MSNLVTEVRDSVEQYGERPAVVFEDRELTYEQLWGRIGQFAAGLDERGIGEGDRVAVYLPNLPQFVTAFHGTLRAGGIVVPMNPQYRARETEHLLTDSGARVVVTLPELVGELEQVRDDTAVEHVVTVGESDGETGTRFEAFLGDGQEGVIDRADDAVAVQPYTSGTTGRPKGVLLTHENLRSNAKAVSDLLPGGPEPEDRHIGVLPLFHIYGMTVVMNGALFFGCSYYPMPEWDAQAAVSLTEDEEVTVMNGVPAMYLDIVNQPDAESFDLSSLRFANAGGSGLPREVAEGFAALYDLELYEGYGLTETSPITHANRPGELRPGSIGRPIDGVDAKVVDEDFREVARIERGPLDEEDLDSGGNDKGNASALDDVTGEIVVAGPNVMKGYHDRPEATEEAFTEVDGRTWFHTGDVGYWDADDYFYVVDRKTDLVVSGGYNVYPREVEEVLFEHEAVADVAVVGVPDERRGETVKAFVVPDPGADVTADELREFCLDRLAAYKHPREIEFREELPRTTTGKVKKYELREGETTDADEAASVGEAGE
ncbi:long-chain-fatty-acid--CoA ligase [Halobacteriales archaeon QH_8_67_27]|nr:MAG: long-chain-fatty-acid--CoA ligase [Halobacteriales archaeon QH_8_67_27]